MIIYNKVSGLNYVLCIAQLRTLHCTITYFALHNYVLCIAQLRTLYFFGT